MTPVRQRLLAILAWGLMACVTVRAQEPVPRPALPEMGPDMRRGEIQRLFDAYLVMEAQRVLALTEQQYPQFVSRLRQLQDTRRRNQQARTQILGDLQRLTSVAPATRPDDAALAERLNALQELDARAVAEARKAYAALAEVLDVRQQARLRLFEEQVERRKLELLVRARARNRPADLPRRGGRPSPPAR